VLFKSKDLNAEFPSLTEVAAAGPTTQPRQKTCDSNREGVLDGTGSDQGEQQQGGILRCCQLLYHLILTMIDT